MSAAAEFPWTPHIPGTELCSLFENAPVAMAQFQRPGTIAAFNPALEQMLGPRPKLARSVRFTDLLPPQDHAAAERLLRELFDGERASFLIETRPATTAERPVRWTAWRVHGTNGESDSAIAMAEELTSSQHTEQRLRQAEKLEAVGRLAGGIAHDFNNLLTGVLLYCDLLLSGLEPCHRVRKYAEEIRKAGMQASGLVRQLLTVARPTKSEPRLLSLNEIAECLRNLLRHLIGENIELEFHLDPNLGLVKMDPTAAQQILLNLVLNARDAMPRGGQITVETSNCQIQVLSDQSSGMNRAATLPCALFRVGDNGSGMDAVTRGRLFEAFFTTKGGKGTGLGLTTVHDIVRSNGGLIHVDSAPDCGTRITVLLPLATEAPAIPPSANQFEPARNEGAIPQSEE